MKLKKEYWWRPEAEFTVAEAVDAECTPDATGPLVGRLVQELHSAGVLDDSAIFRILGIGWKKAED